MVDNIKNYVKANLRPNEKLILEGKLHWTILLPHLLGILVFIGFITIWKPLIRLLTTQLAITDKRVIGKTGFIKTSVMDTPLDKITNIVVTTGFWGKIFKYGNIRITTISGDYVFNGLADPEGFKTTLQQQMDFSEESKMDMHAGKIAAAMKSI